jgi:glycoprotein 3-alpha-L-fucosyltransferase
VLGAPNVAEFAPAPDAFLDVRDFSDPAALATRLRELSADAAAYDAMLAWKRTGYSKSFAALVAACAEDPWVRLARKLGAA